MVFNLKEMFEYLLYFWVVNIPNYSILFWLLFKDSIPFISREAIYEALLFLLSNSMYYNFLREWRQAGGHQSLSTSHTINDVSSPTPSASRKKQRTSQSLSTHMPVITPSPSAAALGSRGRKPRQV